MPTGSTFLGTWTGDRSDRERGAALVEYALLIALIAIVCILALAALGISVSEKFSELQSTFG